MKSIETQYKDELLSLDIFEKNVKEFGLTYIDNFFTETKQQFVKIFKLLEKLSKDIELTKLFVQWSEIMDTANVTQAKINNRLMELRHVILQYFSSNEQTFIRKYFQSYPSCFETIRIIKLSQLYINNYDQFKFERIQQIYDLNNQHQNCNSQSLNKNLSKLSKQDDVKSANPFLQNSMIPQKIQQDKVMVPTKHRLVSNKLPHMFPDQFSKLYQEIVPQHKGLKDFKNQENLKSFSSILQSCEETKSDYHIVQQFGTCIKRALWVIENDDVYKAIKCQDTCSPIFFTKKPNQDIQFGFGVQSLKEINQIKVLSLKDVQVKFTHSDFVEIDGKGFQHLSIEISKLIEKLYQKLLETKKDNSTNILTRKGKILKRFEVIQEPTILLKVDPQVKWMVKSANIDSGLKYSFENVYTVNISCAYYQMLAEKRNITSHFTHSNQVTYSITFNHNNPAQQGIIHGPNPFTESYSIEMVKKSDRPNYFDYITTFDRQSVSNKQQLSISQQQSKTTLIYTLNKEDAEYKYLSKLFYDSFLKGRVDVLQQQIQQQPKANVIKIEKIMNKSLYERFVIEIKFMSEKYPQKDFEDIMQHLFHGSYQTDPQQIYDSSIGFDFRLSKDKGLYGRGAYFAKNSGYSDSYRYRIPYSSQYQIFVALVITGDRVTLNKTEPDLKAPPYKPGSKTQRFDSVHNGLQDHYIVYDHYRAYPGYLITYETI